MSKGISRRAVTVITGGQTGVDQLALFAAERHGFATGGWAPPWFRTCAGRAQWLHTRFRLEEFPQKGSFGAALAQRTRANVLRSNVYVILGDCETNKGTALTFQHVTNRCVALGLDVEDRMFYHPAFGGDPAATAQRVWTAVRGPIKLMVAGPRVAPDWAAEFLNGFFVELARLAQRGEN